MKSYFQREVIPDKLLNPFKSVSSSDRTTSMKSSNTEAVRNVLGREGNTFISLVQHFLLLEYFQEEGINKFLG